MATTVYFATNRAVSNSNDPINGYPAQIVPPSNPAAMTYGVAFVDGINVAADNAGAISQIAATSKGQFSDAMTADLSAPGRNLLVFVHGFDNTFSDAITRAAFNREWLAASGAAGADTTVIAFSWPSKGQIVAFPVLAADYLADQNMARNSGLHLMAFLANLQPILLAARRSGQSAFLLAHSMGNLALQSAIENWFLHGNGSARMFQQAFLAAGDCAYDAFHQPNQAGLSALPLVSDRVSILYSHADDVLKLSKVVNLGAQRLGQDGPRDRADTTQFPVATYHMLDCTSYKDYDFNPITSHQYYRQSPSVRKLIAAAI